jgi:ornithine--oxo-acid transaminase
VGIEFCAPKQLRLRIPYEAVAAMHGGIFGPDCGDAAVRDFGFLTQICGNNSMVLKVAPPRWWRVTSNSMRWGQRFTKW